MNSPSPIAGETGRTQAAPRSRYQRHHTTRPIAGIAAAAVIGGPDVEWGEVVKAVVVGVAGEQVDDEELTTYVKSRLASYKAPASYQWVDDLPRNHMGKVLKNELRDLYGQPAAAQT